jgi:hypothetical protein
MVEVISMIYKTAQNSPTIPIFSTEEAKVTNAQPKGTLNARNPTDGGTRFQSQTDQLMENKIQAEARAAQLNSKLSQTPNYEADDYE